MLASQLLKDVVIPAGASPPTATENARRLPEVARALMLTSNEDAEIAENTGILFVIPRGGGVPSPAFKDAVEQQVTWFFRTR